jgi:hypothetical protein
MRRRQITFLLAGLIAGLTCVTLGSLEIEIAIPALVYGVGPLFFVAVVASIVITGAGRYIQSGFLRYLAGFFLCTITYFVGIVMIFAVMGLSQWFGLRASEHLEDFRIDVWLSLIAAGLVAAVGIAAFTALLTRKWSTSLLWRLMFAGLVTIVVTFTVNLAFHNDWSFLHILLPVGNALFCFLVGTHIWRPAGKSFEEEAK